MRYFHCLAVVCSYLHGQRARLYIFMYMFHLLDCKSRRIDHICYLDLQRVFELQEEDHVMLLCEGPLHIKVSKLRGEDAVKELVTSATAVVHDTVLIIDTYG